MIIIINYKSLITLVQLQPLSILRKITSATQLVQVKVVTKRFLKKKMVGDVKSVAKLIHNQIIGNNYNL